MKMDDTRINTLLAKYWSCATTVEEERELRLFFTREPVPPELRPYQAWFRTADAEELPPLGPQFDRELLAQIAKEKRQQRRKWYMKLAFGIGLIAVFAGLLILYFFYSF